MPQNVAALLDKAKTVHRLPSDYKLALVMGVSHNSLASYRAGKTLPDARVIARLCELTGDDAAVLLAEVEEQRATAPEARALWHAMAVRLQSAAAAGVFSVVAAVLLGLGFPSGEARADSVVSQLNSLYIVEGRKLSYKYAQWFIQGFTRMKSAAPSVLRFLRSVFGGFHVSRASSTAVV